jgi:translation initiation factor IF-2
MRSRGVKVADIAILVVAADDGVQPQTIEAISHIRNAGLPMVVAINKIDKEGANIEKVKRELSELGLTPEDWSGETICVEISAKQKINITKLLDTLLLVTDIEKDKIMANPSRPAVGTIIESHINKGEGPVATVLIQRGILKAGDFVEIGQVYGKIRMMRDFQGGEVKEAPPSMPVKILGLKAVPQVGEILQVKSREDIKKEVRRLPKQYKELYRGKLRKIVPQKEGEREVKKINLYLKADVLGSIGAIIEALEKVQHRQVIAEVVHQGLGNITEADVLKAERSEALLLGFHVQITTKALELAQDLGIKVQTFEIIYELVNLVRQEIEKLLTPQVWQELSGKAQVLALFRQDKDFQIIGAKVTLGKIENNTLVKVYHQEKLTTSGQLVELQSGKQDVTEVVVGQEAGLKIQQADKILVGDSLEFFKEIKKV